MRIFKMFSRFNKHATRCAAAVSVLFDQVPLQHSDSRQPPDTGQRYKGLGPLVSAHQSESHSRNHIAGRMTLGNRPASSASLRDNADELSAWISANTGNPLRRNGPIMTTTTPSMTVEEASAVASSTPGQEWTLGGNMVYQAIGNYDPTIADDYSSIMGMVDSAKINIDLGGMSWLTSHPSHFCGNSML